MKLLLERVESFPNNQRFIFGQRVADAALDIMDLLVEAAYRKEKREVLVRLAREQNLTEVGTWVFGSNLRFLCILREKPFFRHS